MSAGKLIAALALALVLLNCPDLHAAAIPFEIIFQVETATNINPSLCTDGVSYAFGCGVHVGDIYRGTFDMDSSVLAETGNNLPATGFSRFNLTIGDVSWIQGSFGIGFRGPDPQHTPGFGLDIAGGQIVGLRGGVFSSADSPWIDFFGTGFNAFDSTFEDLTGTVQVAAIPEPSTWLLLATGLVIVISAAGRKAWENH